MKLLQGVLNSSILFKSYEMGLQVSCGLDSEMSVKKWSRGIVGSTLELIHL